MKSVDLVSEVLTKWSADKPIPNPNVKTQSETSAKWNLLERDKSDSMLFGQQMTRFEADFLVAPGFNELVGVAGKKQDSSVLKEFF